MADTVIQEDDYYSDRLKRLRLAAALDDEHRIEHPENANGCAWCEYLQDEAAEYLQDEARRNDY